MMTVNCLLFPELLISQDPFGCSLTKVYESMGTMLPLPTSLCLSFANARFIRISLLLGLLGIIGGLEMVGKPRERVFFAHLVLLILSIFMSWYFLFALILPFIPL